jgi:3-methyladenine DNA glycosylase AlkD
MGDPLIADLQARLEAKATRATKEWWEAYLKGVVPFRGVGMAVARHELRRWHIAHDLGTVLSDERQLDLSVELMRQPMAEDKLAGILYTAELLIPTERIDWREALPRWAEILDDGYIDDWGTCDWLCLKVLGPLAARSGEPCARAIADWRTADNLWRRRAAGVTFVPVAKHGDENFDGFTELVFEVCAETVRSPERFAQTGTGWVLRELSLAAPERVAEFVAKHSGRMSLEAIRSAVRKLPGPVSRGLVRGGRG